MQDRLPLKRSPIARAPIWREIYVLAGGLQEPVLAKWSYDREVWADMDGNALRAVAWWLPEGKP